MFLNPRPTFSASINRLRAATCRIPAHFCPSYASLVLAIPTFLISQSTTKLHFKTWYKNDVWCSSSEAKTRENMPPVGRCQRRLRREPLTSRGGAGVAASPRPPVHWSDPVYWNMTQPVQYVLARATRAQPYLLPGILLSTIHSLSREKSPSIPPSLPPAVSFTTFFTCEIFRSNTIEYVMFDALI